MAGKDDVETERFAPTSGRVTGVLGVVASIGFIAIGLAFDDAEVADWGIALAVFVGVLSWAALLRPRVSMDADSLVLRGITGTVVLPLVRIESVVVQQFMAVTVGGKRYVSAAVGRSRGQQARDQSGGSGARQGSGSSLPSSLRPARTLGAGGSTPSRAARAGGGMSYGYYVESKVQARVADARRRQVGDAGADAVVERRRAWVEIVLLSLSAVTAVVLFLV